MRHRIQQSVGLLLVMVMAMTAWVPSTGAADTDALNGQSTIKSPPAIEKADTGGVSTMRQANRNRGIVSVKGTVVRLDDGSIGILGKRVKGPGKNNNDDEAVQQAEQLNGNGNSNTSSRKRRNRTGLYMFEVDQQTVVLTKRKALADYEDMDIGDSVQVWATSWNGGTALVIWDKSLYLTRLTGIVSDIDEGNQAVEIEVGTGRRMRTAWIETDDQTRYNGGGFGDISLGDKITALGEWNSVDRTMMAREITITENGNGDPNQNQVTVTVRTWPSTLTVKVDGQNRTDPYTLTDTKGKKHTVEAAKTQTRDGIVYTFSSWSDGGARKHTVTLQNTMTLTANYSYQYENGNGNTNANANTNTSTGTMTETDI